MCSEIEFPGSYLHLLQPIAHQPPSRIHQRPLAGLPKFDEDTQGPSAERKSYCNVNSTLLWPTLFSLLVTRYTGILLLRVGFLSTSLLSHGDTLSRSLHLLTTYTYFLRRYLLATGGWSVWRFRHFGKPLGWSLGEVLYSILL